MCGTRSPKIDVTQSPTSCDDRRAERPGRDGTRHHSIVRPRAARARQLDALAEPDRLRVLSGVAARPDATADATSLAAELGSRTDEVKKHLTVLTALQLLEEVTDRPGTFTPTADTWMRFSRLIVAVERPGHPAASRSAARSAAVRSSSPGAATNHRAGSRTGSARRSPRKPSSDTSSTATGCWQNAPESRSIYRP